MQYVALTPWIGNNNHLFPLSPLVFVISLTKPTIANDNKWHLILGIDESVCSPALYYLVAPEKWLLFHSHRHLLPMNHLDGSTCLHNGQKPQKHFSIDCDYKGDVRMYWAANTIRLMYYEHFIRRDFCGAENGNLSVCHHQNVKFMDCVGKCRQIQQ